MRIDAGYRVDLLVEDIVIVELKAVEQLTAVDQAQLLSYLKISGCPAGLLINFHSRLLKHGIRRLLNGVQPDGPQASQMYAAAR